MALNFRREAAEIAQGDATDRTIWLQFLGSPPLREVVQGALGLPSQFASIDLDQQVAEISRRAERFFNVSSPTELTDPARIEELVDRFLLNQQLLGGQIASTTRGAVALSLLQPSGFGFGAQTNLFASSFPEIGLA